MVGDRERALAAGCDALLYPQDVGEVAAALDRERGRSLPEERVTEALERVRRAADRVAGPTEAAASGDQGVPWGRDRDMEWALGVAGRGIRVLRGEPRVAEAAELLVVDDDVGGPFPAAPRAPFAGALAEEGLQVTEVERPSGSRPLVVALYADIKGFKGRPGLSSAAVDRLGTAVTVPMGATVVLFGHPRTAPQVPGSHLLGAWGGEALMQRAAARWLARYSSSGSSASEPSNR